jgi:hypothetical protein
VYVTVRKYADKAALIDGLVPPVRDGFVPLLRRAPGFKGYCAFASEDGHAVSVTVFEDRQTAVRADDRVREWVVSNLRDLLPNPPEVLTGEALLHEVSKPRSGGPAMFATVRVYEGVGPREEVLPWACRRRCSTRASTRWRRTGGWWRRCATAGSRRTRPA